MKFFYHGLIKVISGGQTGADQAGIITASNFGLVTGGMIPAGWRTSDGPAPHLQKLGLIEHDSPLYPPRTKCNVRDSDATVRLARDFSSPGEKLTARYCRELGKPFFDVKLDGIDYEKKALALVEFLKHHSVAVLNVAGNREQPHTSIFADASTVLEFAFSKLDAENLLIKIQDE